MNARARAFFIAGSAGLALGGVLHLWGQFGGDDPPLARAMIESAMRAYKAEAMGMTYSLMDVTQCWGVYFGVLAIFFSSTENSSLEVFTILCTVAQERLNLIAILLMLSLSMK